jgi:hypothetical protein
VQCTILKINIYSIIIRRCELEESGYTRCLEGAAVDITDKLDKLQRCDNVTYWKPQGTFGSGFDADAFAHNEQSFTSQFDWGWQKSPITNSSSSLPLVPSRTCSLTDSTCFDLSGPACKHLWISVYAYGGSETLAALPDFVAAIEKSKLFYLVDSPANACLLFVGLDPTMTIAQLWKMDSWNNGTNHIILMPHQHPDLLGPTLDIGNAAVVSRSGYGYSFRPNFDIQMAWSNGDQVDITAEQDREYHARATSIVARNTLLSFQGDIPAGDKFSWEQNFWYGYRYMAVRFLHNPSRGILTYSVPKPNQPEFSSTCQTETPPISYDESLLSSKFVLCFGGEDGPYSARFFDAIRAGAVPVVSSDLILPLEPEADWSSCVVRVSYENIIHLPEVLEALVKSGQWEMMHSTCLTMSMLVASWKVTHLMWMDTWSHRIKEHNKLK